jgi:GTPase SAR1 family protein
MTTIQQLCKILLKFRNYYHTSLKNDDNNIEFTIQGILFLISDTSGQDEYFTLMDGWINDSDGAILVYDITSKNSLNFIEKCIKRINRIKNNGNSYKNLSHPFFPLIVNKLY